ncbi:hypothetical protein ScPMuIL_017516 [Solemya velum]
MNCCVHVDYHVNIHLGMKEKQYSSLEKKDDLGLTYNLNWADAEHNKGFLLIGVITAKKYIDNRAQIAFETWAKSINGKVIFFTSEGSVPNANIPVISLRGVDDSYPPQKKSLMMLKYMNDHFIDDFEWFMRADDDILIKGEKLELFLRSVNSSKPQFIGQTGLGTKSELGQLSLDTTENYCMGGPGMVFSQETMKLFAPHAEKCLNDMKTTHEDVEVGRCVRKYAGIPCTWAFEMQHIFFHNFKEDKGSFKHTLKDQAVYRALTLHPVKEPGQQYRIQNYLNSDKISDLHFKELKLQREVNIMDRILGTPRKQQNHFGFGPSLMKSIPKTSDEVLSWEFLVLNSLSSHFLTNPKQSIGVPLKSALESIVGQVMHTLNQNSRQRGRTIDYKKLLYGYVRTNPLYGADYILDLLLTYKKHKGRKITLPVRRHAYIQQTFSETEFIEDPEVSNSVQSASGDFTAYSQFRSPLSDGSITNKKINFIVPLSGRYLTFQRFIKNFEEVCLKNRENAELFIVLFDGDDLVEMNKIIDLIGRYQKQYGGDSIEIIHAHGSFSRGRALEIGADQCSESSLLFFVDVDIVLTHDALRRIRLNTREGLQVYFPIVFSQFDPHVICESKNEKECSMDLQNFNSDMGYWRHFGFGIASMFRSDLISIGGFDLTIQGWGKEDVDLFSRFIGSNMTVFRAIDPGMIHAFHPVICDPNVDPVQFKMCIGSKSSSYASQKNLANIIRSMPQILQNSPSKKFS